MTKLDPGLRFLAEQSPRMVERFAEESVFNVEPRAGEVAGATVLVQFTGDVSALERAGLQVRSVVGDVAVGQLGLDRLSALAELDAVVRVEVSRVLHRELDLALAEANVTAVHLGPPVHRGAGAIVGIIDTGVDYLHPAFRGEDGGSRILAIWDQGLVPQGGEVSPAGYGYGVEYRKPAIDAAIAAAIRHQDGGEGFHGTHVAGIAAGNGSAGPGEPPGDFVGAAPDASIVCVANTRGRMSGVGLGDSADALEAVRYIFDVAGAAGLPAVINMSLGDNIGPHDGTSLLEQGIDSQLGPGRILVKSAGNEGHQRAHAAGTIGPGQTRPVGFDVPAGRSNLLLIDIWYGGADRYGIRLDPPGGATAPVARAGQDRRGATNAGNVFSIYSDLDDSVNHDNRILLAIDRGSAPALEPGAWSFTLVGEAVSAGRWDAWIQRGEPRVRFRAPLDSPAGTISIPGTAREVITVGSYVSRSESPGAISTFSSHGPTRDGRPAPTLAAPGQTLMAPQPAAAHTGYDLKQGTSMAAPMVTGTVALLLAKNPDLAPAEIRDCLTATARSDAFTGTTPNETWGAGKLDAAAAFHRVPPPPAP